MIQIVDNYDSFTYNLVQRLGEIDARLEIRVDRNDEITVDEILKRAPDRVILSPGPCTPNEAVISVECVERLAGKMPLLGVCLGHQSIGQAYGAKIVRADQLMHGKTDKIFHEGGPLLAGLDNPFQATRYHSLLIQPDTLSRHVGGDGLEHRTRRAARNHGNSTPRTAGVWFAISPREFFDARRHRYFAAVFAD